MSTLDRSRSTEALQIQQQDLSVKVALVTGATKGIGRAICLDLATRGAARLGTFSSPDSAQLFDTIKHDILSLYPSSSAANSYAPIPAAPKLIGISADISAASVCTANILQSLQQHFDGKVDIIIFNAAIMGLAKRGDGSVTEEFVNAALSGNVKFPVLMMEGLVTQSMIREDGRVLSISSDGVRARRLAGGAVYAATKAALECVMRKWADELGTRPGMKGTTFNSVSVGFTKTEAYSRIPAVIRETLTTADAEEVAVGNRIGEVEDIADVVRLLVGEKARWISGSVVDASGGKAKILSLSQHDDPLMLSG